MWLVLGSNGVIVRAVEGRVPQLEEIVQLPLEIIGRSTIVAQQPLSQCLYEMCLAVHHLSQKWWWWWSIVAPRCSTLAPRLGCAWLL